MFRKSIILVGILVSSCATVGVTQMKSAPAKPGYCNLEIFSNESEIKRPFEVLCLLDSKTGGDAFADKTMAGAIKLAKPKACECGADAILVTGGRSEGVTAFTWGEGFAVLKAIRFTDSQPIDRK